MSDNSALARRNDVIDQPVQVQRCWELHHNRERKQGHRIEQL